MKYLALLIFLCTLSVFGNSQVKNDYSDAIPFIEVWLDAQKDYEKLVGISAIVVEDQEVIWEGAFGFANAETKLQFDPSTICSICSISKLFTSVSIMKLYDEGKLRLDDRIEDVLPWYNLKQQYESSGPITIRSLLTHSSGLPREAKFSYWSPPNFHFPTKMEVRREMGNQLTMYPASTNFHYSNLGMTLLGEIVEEISGMEYDEYVQQSIIRPLQLKSTKTYMPEDLHGTELAIGYGALNRSGERKAVPFFQPKGLAAAAGFTSNVRDLGKFASWQFRLLSGSKDFEILKASTLKNMQRIHWTNPDGGITWGLGFSVYSGNDGMNWVGHSGHCPGYKSILEINPSTKQAIAVILNSGATTHPVKYSYGIQGLMRRMQYTAISKENRKESLSNLEDYTGMYSKDPYWSELYVGIIGENLAMLYLPTDEPLSNFEEYVHIEGDIFRKINNDGTYGIYLGFLRDENGNVTHFVSDNNFSWKIKEK